MVDSLQGGAECTVISVIAKDAAMSEELRSYSDEHPRLEYRHFVLDEAPHLKTYLSRPDAAHWLGCQVGKTFQNDLTIVYASWYVDAPWWLLFVLSCTPLATWFAIQQRRRRRISNRLCHKCGYDLRATPDRCPECGTARTAEQQIQRGF